MREREKGTKASENLMSRIIDIKISQEKEREREVRKHCK